MARRATVRWDAVASAWRSDVGPHGKNGRRKPVHFREIPDTPRGKRAAEAALADYVAARDKAESAAQESADNPRVWQVVDAYLEHSERTVEPRTLAGHSERLNLWMSKAPGATVDSEGAWSDGRHAKTLSASDLSRPVKAMVADGHSPHYVVGMLRSVKACWTWASRLDEDRDPPRLVPENVFLEVAGPKMPDAPERYMPAEFAEPLLRWIEERAAEYPGVTGHFERLTALMFRVIYESGARPGELCRATWKNFDAASGVFVFKKHKTSGKVGRPRRVPLTAELAARVAVCRDRVGAHPEFVFTHKLGRNDRDDAGDAASLAGEPWTVGPLGQKFRILRRASGLDVRVRDGSGQVPELNPECTLYDFRRTFSTDAGEAGFSDERTAAALGNSAEMVAKVYQTKHAAGAVEIAEAISARRKGRK